MEFKREHLITGIISGVISGLIIVNANDISILITSLLKINLAYAKILLPLIVFALTLLILYLALRWSQK